jgi:hypothetical protein
VRGVLWSLVISVCAGTSFFGDPAYLPQHAYRACKRCLSSPLSATTSKSEYQKPFARCQQPSDELGESVASAKTSRPCRQWVPLWRSHHVLQHHPYPTGYDGAFYVDITNLRLGPPAGRLGVIPEPLVGAD